MTDMKLSILIILISYFNQQHVHINGESCPASVPTMKIVKSCPQTYVEWRAAADIKQCQKMDSHNCKSFEYHCLMNQNENGFLEVCAPTWYISGFCAMFNTDEERVIDNFKLDCTNLTKEQSCPSRYISTDAYKYQWCYDHVKKEKTTMQQNADEPDNVAASGSGDSKVFVVALLIAVIFAVAVLVLVVMLILIRKQIIWKRVAQSTSTRDGENQVLLEEDDGKTTNKETVEFDGISDQAPTPNALLKNATEDEKKGRLEDREELKKKEPVSKITSPTPNAHFKNAPEDEKKGRLEEREELKKKEPVSKITSPTPNALFKNAPEDEQKGRLEEREELKKKEPVSKITSPTPNAHFKNAPEDEKKGRLEEREELKKKETVSKITSQTDPNRSGDRFGNGPPQGRPPMSESTSRNHIEEDHGNKKEEKKANDGDTHSLKGEEENAEKVQTDGGRSTSCDNTAANKNSSSGTSNTSDHKSLSDNNEIKDGNVEDKKDDKRATKGNEDSGQTEAHTPKEYIPITIDAIKKQLPISPK